MISRLLRRLQGRPTLPGDDDAFPVEGSPCASSHAPAALTTPDLTHRFVAHVMGTECGPGNPGVVEEALHHLRMIAGRLDVRRMPRLPALVPQLLADMRRDDSDAAQLASLLARDPTIAGEVVRVANSAFYQRGQPAGSLQQAVQRIGHEGLRHVVLTSVMRPIMRAHPTQPGHAAAERLWPQVEACTWLCGRLAPGRCDIGEAQLAGVVAGTGAAALLRMASVALLTPAAGDPQFADGFMRIARGLTSQAAEYWQLPEQARAALSGATPCAPLGMVLQSAEALAMGAAMLGGAALDMAGIAAIDVALPRRQEERIALVEALQRETTREAEALA
ncbi:MAG: HDOD domain-containing protein [Lysobacter sp.]|nr:MAG: HDOD domain-containing protein [Lysobacter sp.]